MASRQEVRIGVVGAGGIVRGRHMPGLAAIPGVEVVVVCNRSRESGERFASEFGIERVETDWRAVVEAPDVDAVLIGTWPYMHHPVSIAALGAGKHVFCQARMAMNAKEAREMLAKAKQSGKVAMLCPPPIGLKGDYLMKELIGQGFLGEPREVRVVDTGGGYADPNKPLHWRQKAKYSGVNTLTVGMYAEVLNRWVGLANRVAAQAYTYVKERQDPETGKVAPVDAPDAVVASAEMENGALGSFIFSGAEPIAHEERMTFIGTEGALYYDAADDRILALRAGETEAREVPIPEEEARLWTVEADFIRAIREGTPVSPDFEEGARYMAFTEAVIVSARTGQAVEPATLGL